ncbi:MAG: glycerophosphodiester phosphodiesterase [Micrococcales bacterium]|nr:glycerophosphodiester phosphodiesterase [Micrococcales bacterium]
MESDIRLTRDGHLVCFHDETLQRTTGVPGRIADLTLEQVRLLRIDGAEPIPTLEETLTAFPETYFTGDLKDRAAIALLAEVLRRSDFGSRVCVAGAWDGWLGQLRREVPAAHTALGWRSLTTLIGCGKAGVAAPRRIATGGWAHVPIRLGRLPIFAGRLVERAHGVGVRVIVWTVNDPVEMHALLDAGVDGIITDRPDLLREVLIARGTWTPMDESVENALA